MINAIKSIFASFLLFLLDIVLNIVQFFVAYFSQIFTRLARFCSLDSDNKAYKIVKIIFDIIFFIPCLTIAFFEFLVMFLALSSLKIITSFTKWIPLIGFLIGVIADAIMNFLNLIFAAFFFFLFLPDVIFNEF